MRLYPIFGSVSIALVATLNLTCGKQRDVDITLTPSMQPGDYLPEDVTNGVNVSAVSEQTVDESNIYCTSDGTEPAAIDTHRIAGALSLREGKNEIKCLGIFTVKMKRNSPLSTPRTKEVSVASSWTYTIASSNLPTATSPTVGTTTSSTATTTTTTTTTTSTTTSTATPAPIQKVQSTEAAVASGGSVEATWSAPTTAGNLLVFVVGAARGSGTPTGTPSVVPPAGWTTATSASIASAGAAYGHVLGIYYKENSISQTVSGAFTCSDCNGSMVIAGGEYSGISSTALDVSASLASTATNLATSGTTGTTSQANELLIAGYESNVSTWDTPGNGFTQVVKLQATGVNATSVLFADNIVSSIGTYSCSTYLSSDQTVSKRWAGAIATFKRAP